MAAKKVRASKQPSKAPSERGVVNAAADRMRGEFDGDHGRPDARATESVRGLPFRFVDDSKQDFTAEGLPVLKIEILASSLNTPSLPDVVASRITELEGDALGRGEIPTKIRELLLNIAEALDWSIIRARTEARERARGLEPLWNGADLGERLELALAILNDEGSKVGKDDGSKAREHARAYRAVAAMAGIRARGGEFMRFSIELRRYARERWEPDHTDAEILAALEGVTAEGKGGRGKRGPVHALAALSGEEASVIRAALKRALR